MVVKYSEDVKRIILQYKQLRELTDANADEIAGDKTTAQFSEETFNLNNINVEVLDHLWLPLGAYNIGLPHRHPFRLVADSRDYRSNLEKVKEVITSTYHIDPSLFCIIEGENGKYAAILMSANQENIKVIEDAMQKLGFSRANPTDGLLLEDIRHRFYLNLRFEPAPANDFAR